MFTAPTAADGALDVDATAVDVCLDADADTTGDVAEVASAGADGAAALLCTAADCESTGGLELLLLVVPALGSAYCTTGVKSAVFIVRINVLFGLQAVALFSHAFLFLPCSTLFDKMLQSVYANRRILSI